MASQAETFCRDRRLYDVRRGVVYLRRTDDLAQHQWRHYGTVPAIKTHVIREVGVTTRLSDAAEGSQYDVSADQSLSDARGSESDVRRPPRGDARVSVSDAACVDAEVSVPPGNGNNVLYKTTVLEDFSSVHPQISVTEITETTNTSPGATPRHPPLAGVPDSKGDGGRGRRSTSGDLNISPPLSTTRDRAGSSSWTDSDVPAPEYGTAPRVHAHTQPTSTFKDEQRHRLKECVTLSEDHPAGAHFNTWGSRDWAVDSKLDPDTGPKNHAPKRYPIMSRAAGLSKKGAGRRQLKTLTDFRSQNGTVRIIRPVPSVADTKRAAASSDLTDYDDLDLATLGREQTYAMLKRIDRLLEPTRAYFTSDLASSQCEVCSSTPPSITISPLTDSLGLDEEPDGPPGSQRAQDHVHVHRHDFHAYFEKSHGQRGHTHPDQGYDAHGHTDSEHAYVNRIQRRLDQFYGHQPHGSRGSQARLSKQSHHFRGHSEPARVYPNRSGQQTSTPGQGEYYREDNSLTRPSQDSGGGFDLDDSFTPRRHTHPLRSLPPVKPSHSVPKRSREGFSDVHSHSYNARAGSRVQGDGDAKGKVAGVKGKGWGSLSEVVAQLEKKGVDLHLKCQDWIRKQ